MDPLTGSIKALDGIVSVPTILDVVCRTTGMGFAAVARVTQDRWIACNVLDKINFGLKAGGELDIETTICHEIRESRDPVIIDNVSEDDRYKAHHTPLLYGFQSYISMPIVLKDGSFFGTLCAIDPKPAKVNKPEIVAMFKLFAELIAFHLDAHDRVVEMEAKLHEAKGTAELREQFIAVLGHDLRNPLGAISSGAVLLNQFALPDRAKQIVHMMQTCVGRMSGLIENILDFARGRLGDGITLNLESGVELEPVLRHVIAEMVASYPGRPIDVLIDTPRAMRVDKGRIAQLFSNLLGNAFTYGAPDQPLRITALQTEKTFELAVANGGKVIPQATIDHLFQPFYRSGDQSHSEGLGLGLYIVSEIAKSHGGSIEVRSDAIETRFTFHLPQN